MLENCLTSPRPQIAGSIYHNSAYLLDRAWYDLEEIRLVTKVQYATPRTPGLYPPQLSYARRNEEGAVKGGGDGNSDG
jgi:hypothetical protein